MSRRLELALLLGILTVCAPWFAWPLAWSASDNARLVAVFNTDEALHVSMLEGAIREGSPRLEFGSYGHLYFNLVLVPLLLASRFTEITQQHIIVLLRLVSAAFGVATIALTFLLTRRYFGSLAAWLAALLLAVVPLNFLSLSVISHPDVAQSFFLLLGVYCCCRLVEERSLGWLVRASIAAGLAFATKYLGLLLLPIIWTIAIRHIFCERDDALNPIDPARFTRGGRLVTALLAIGSMVMAICLKPDMAAFFLSPDGRIESPVIELLLRVARMTAWALGGGLLLLVGVTPVWSWLARSRRLVRGLHALVISGAGFWLAFILASPFSLLRLQFLSGMYHESRHTAFGHWFEGSRNGLVWLLALASRGSPDETDFTTAVLLDNLIVGLALAALVAFLYQSWRSGWRSLFSPEGVMWAWVLIHLGFLVLCVRMRPPRFLLPVIPLVIVLATRPIDLAIEPLRRRLSAGTVRLMATGLSVLILLWEVPQAVGRIVAYRQAALRRVDGSLAVSAGNWLAATYPASTRILHDHYTYVPPAFVDARATYGGTLRLLREQGPDLVLVCEAIAKEYSDRSRAPEFWLGEETFRAVHEYYAALREGRAGYKLVRDFGEIRVYERE